VWFEGVLDREGRIGWTDSWVGNRDEGGSRDAVSCEDEGEDVEPSAVSDVSLRMRESDNSLHAPRAASPVTVVEVEAFALEDKGAHAILRTLSESSTWIKG
jgi:hypothetical protein